MGFPTSGRATGALLSNPVTAAQGGTGSTTNAGAALLIAQALAPWHAVPDTAIAAATLTVLPSGTPAATVYAAANALRTIQRDHVISYATTSALGAHVAPQPLDRVTAPIATNDGTFDTLIADFFAMGVQHAASTSGVHFATGSDEYLASITINAAPVSDDERRENYNAVFAYWGQHIRRNVGNGEAFGFGGIAVSPAMATASGTNLIVPTVYNGVWYPATAANIAPGLYDRPFPFLTAANVAAGEVKYIGPAPGSTNAADVMIAVCPDGYTTVQCYLYASTAPGAGKHTIFTVRAATVGGAWADTAAFGDLADANASGSTPGATATPGKLYGLKIVADAGAPATAFTGYLVFSK